MASLSTCKMVFFKDIIIKLLQNKHYDNRRFLPDFSVKHGLLLGEFNETGSFERPKHTGRLA